MAIYEYRCQTCNATMLTGFRGDRYTGDCPDCDSTGPHHRMFSIAVKPAMQEHFNQTTSSYISSMPQFRNELSRKQDEYMTRTGMEAKYVPVDMADMAAVGATEEGLDVTRKKKFDATVNK